ncbi:FAD-dependent oxidoreductase [Soonwooa sp.]|uniref:NAD(P)/FAD-dependent oxidoreductase n=1 Tax=Soonwooa sp. TaxID=1938592 RepID=UPI0026095C6B|nr:FAD-dependent oxidoreductase [Soonwooa sp.]
MKLDYIIVGGGYAGLMFAHQLIKSNKSFLLISDGERSASEISAGVCNPVVLKRFTGVWNAKNEIEAVRSNFSEIETYLGRNFIIDENLVRVFHDDTERELWLRKSENEDLKDFLDTDFLKLKSVKNEYLSGKVHDSLRIDVKAFFKSFYAYLKDENLWLKEAFDFSELNLETNTYKDFRFDKIVFCEGVNVNNNPYFADIPVKGNRGHSILISAGAEVDPYIIKKKFFLFKTNPNQFFVGGTYEWDQTVLEIIPESVNKLTSGLEEIFEEEYKVEEVNVAFRAVVSDRRPIIGAHHEFKNMYIFNGLGARGVMNSNFFSKQLFEHIEFGKEIFPEVDVKRFQ